MKNKGFTLIELLAVIIILSIIAVITTPVIMNMIENARKETSKNSAYGITNSAKQYYYKLEEDPEIFSCSFPNDCQSLNFDGNIPTSGNIRLNDIGIVYGEVTFYDKYTFCIFDNNVYDGTCEETVAKDLKEQIKQKGSTHIYKSDGNIDTEKLYNCIEYDITVKSDETTIPFCVIGETNNEVTLISKEIIGTQIAWNINSLYTQLLNETKTWDNIPAIDNYTYDDTQHGNYKTLSIEDGKATIIKSDDTEVVIGNNSAENTTNQLRARLITAEEAYEVINGTTDILNKTTCNNAPDWLTGTWTSTFHVSNSSSSGIYTDAYQIKNITGINTKCGLYEHTTSDTYGVKAIITIDKSNL